MDDQTMDLVWCFNDKVEDLTLVAIGSALAQCRSMQVAVHIVTTGLSRNFLSRLKAVCDHYGSARPDVVVVDQARVANLQSTEWIPKEAYLRFMLGSLFPQLDRVLYFDCDVLIRQDLAPLWKTPLEGFACAGSDKEWAHDPRYCKQIGLEPSDIYVNAGVLLMNLRQFREQGLESKLMTFARDAKMKLPSIDQDVLNIVLQGQIKTIPSRWNYTAYEFRTQAALAPLAAVLHFTGSVKPWSKREKSRDWRSWQWWLAFFELKAMEARRQKLGLIDRIRLSYVRRMERREFMRLTGSGATDHD